MNLLKSQYKYIAIIIVVILVLLTRINCPVNTYTEKDIADMKEVFNMNSNEKKSLFPVIVGLNNEVEHIFAVPARDAIGTIDIDNAISILEFNKDNEVQVKIIKKDFADEVNGDFYFSFLPQYSDDEIAYAQSRWIICQNFKTKKNHTVFIINNLNDWIGKLAVLNSKDGKFVVEVLRGYDDGDRSVFKKYLNIGDFSKEDFLPDAVVEGGVYDGLPGNALGYHEPWTTSAGKLFIYQNNDKSIKVYDEHGVSSSHIIQNVFNKNKDKFRKVKEILFHQKLPFAIIVDFGNMPDLSKLREQLDNGTINFEQYLKLEKPFTDETLRHAIWLLRWDTQDTNKQLIPIMSDAGNLIPDIDSVKQCSDFQFSPDGKWLVFRDESHGWENPMFISIPISKESPNFLGEPLYLGKALREDSMIKVRGTAWIKEPTSFVISDGLVLYKWNLENIDSSSIINQ